MSENRKKIAIFIDWFLPGYKAGGPIRSVANIVEQLSAVFDFTIITSDRDLGSIAPYKNIKTDILINKNKYRIIYLSPKNQNKTKYIEIINTIDLDIAYFNSLFSVKFTLIPLQIVKKQKKNVKIILAPRGMLGQGALNLKKTKKKVFLVTSKFLGLFKNITWHATDEIELEDIKKYFGQKSDIRLVSNISEKIKPYKDREKNIPKFIFLSRIAKKKNLLFAIKLFNKINTNKKVVFSIYGATEEKDYLKKCRSEAKKTNKNIKIVFKNEIQHEKVNQILSKHHFYILPTLHENFGHSIFEAFSAGCPVIISDQTPWHNLEEKRIGWDISLKNTDKFLKVIHNCIDMTQEDYDKMSKNAFIFAKKFANNPELVEKTKKLFE